MSAEKHDFSGELFIQTCIIEKLIITHQEPIEGIKVWILLGYPSNILGYPIQVNTVITLPRRN